MSKNPDPIEQALADARIRSAKLTEAERQALASAARVAIAESRKAQALGFTDRTPQPKARAEVLLEVAETARAVATLEQRLADRLWKLWPPDNWTGRHLLSALAWSEQKRGIPRERIDAAQRLAMIGSHPGQQSERIAALLLLAEESERLASELKRRPPNRKGEHSPLAWWIVYDLIRAWFEITGHKAGRSVYFSKYAIATCREAGEIISDGTVRQVLAYLKNPSRDG
ncbi:penicillin-binding protein activator [Myxococcota bacterium]|nr:penicillin-binding protein activator [Myxococcota bacterium]